MLAQFMLEKKLRLVWNRVILLLFAILKLVKQIRRSTKEHVYIVMWIHTRLQANIETYKTERLCKSAISSNPATILFGIVVKWGILFQTLSCFRSPTVILTWNKQYFAPNVKTRCSIVHFGRLKCILFASIKHQHTSTCPVILTKVYTHYIMSISHGITSCWDLEQYVQWQCHAKKCVCVVFVIGSYYQYSNNRKLPPVF